MKFYVTSALFFAGLSSIATAHAQTHPPMPAAAAAISAPAPSYQIEEGDVLSVAVLNSPAGFVIPAQVMVAPDGTVSLPLLGSVAVAGQTVSQTTTLLTNKWKLYIIAPAVTVSLTQKHTQTVVFNGLVNHPGVIEYRPALHLLEALAEAGGPMLTADAAKSVVTHADGSEQTLDLSHPERKSDTAVNIALRPGDVVYVPEQQAKVTVVGEVKQPGMIPYKENLTVLEAISASGSVNLDTADLKAAKLTQNGRERPLDLDALLRGGDMAGNVTLMPGDQLVIPKLHNRTYVFGSVGRPGYFLYQPGDRVLDALNGAGGPTREADLGKVNVIHMDKVKNTAQMVRVNLQDFLGKGDIAGNPLIQPGDSLYIPDKHHSLSLNDLLQPLYAVGAIANLKHL